MCNNSLFNIGLLLLTLFVIFAIPVIGFTIMSESTDVFKLKLTLGIHIFICLCVWIMSCVITWLVNIIYFVCEEMLDKNYILALVSGLFDLLSLGMFVWTMINYGTRKNEMERLMNQYPDFMNLLLFMSVFYVISFVTILCFGGPVSLYGFMEWQSKRDQAKRKNNRRHNDI